MGPSWQAKSKVCTWNSNGFKSTKIRVAHVKWSDMTLNYRRIVERYSKPNGVVDGSIPTSCEIFYLLDGIASQVATHHIYSKQRKIKLCVLRYVIDPKATEGGKYTISSVRTSHSSNITTYCNNRCHRSASLSTSDKLSNIYSSYWGYPIQCVCLTNFIWHSTSNPKCHIT